MNSFNTDSYTDMNEHNISSWINHNFDDAATELGEDLVNSILEGIDCE